jgi:DNA-binding transcriptional MocR family regulator
MTEASAPLPESQPEPRYAGRASRMRASEIREFLKLIDRPGIISFAGGIPDPALFPKDAFAAAYARVLADPVLGRQSLQYSVSEGYLPLRSWIAERMGKRGVACGPDNILITSGSQQALDFLGKLLLSPNDTALVTAPTYLGALQAFNAYEPHYDVIEPEAGNMTPGAYAQAADRAGGTAKLAYVVPDFANPTGQTMSLPARERLLALAGDLDIPVLEDAAYTELRYQGAALPALAALDCAASGGIERSRVIHIGTFSKVIAPALRIGWIVAATPVIRRLVLVKQAADLHSGSLDQIVMAEVAAETYDAQVRIVCDSYRARRDAMLAALARHMTKGVTWSTPEGGMFIWVTLPSNVDAGALVERAVSTANVAFVPGRAFFTDGRGTNTLRLSFTLPPPQDIATGIERLGALLAEAS